MSAGLDYPVISTGNLYTAIDTYQPSASSTQQVIQQTYPPYPNGAYNLPGQAYLAPVSTFGLLGQKGQGAPLVVRYVRYNSTANPALVAAPAPVYWTDETMTTVSGAGSEAAFGIASLAGWLLPNTTSVSGLTAAGLNGNWCFIAVSGFIPGAISITSAAAGGVLIGNTGANFTPATIAPGTAITTPSFARVLTAVSGGLSDILVQCDWTY